MSSILIVHAPVLLEEMYRDVDYLMDGAIMVDFMPSFRDEWVGNVVNRIIEYILRVDYNVYPLHLENLDKVTRPLTMFDINYLYDKYSTKLKQVLESNGIQLITPVYLRVMTSKRDIIVSIDGE